MKGLDHPVERTAPEAGSVLGTGKVRLWYHDDESEGEPVALLGGFTAGHFAFDPVRPYMTDYRLITWEPRGLGRSDCPDPSESPYSVAIWASDLHDLLTALGIERTHIWAGGFGSYIAFRFAAEYPEMVGALVTYTDVWAGDEAKGYARIWNVYGAIVENFGTTGFGARVLANIFDVSDVPWFGTWEANNIEEVLHPETVATTVGYGCLHADVREDLWRIKAPTLIVQGNHTWDGEVLEMTDDSSLQLIRERIAHVEVAVIPDTHPAYVLVQKPEECAGAVRAFLGRHSLRGAHERREK